MSGANGGAKRRLAGDLAEPADPQTVSGRPAAAHDGGDPCGANTLQPRTRCGSSRRSLRTSEDSPERSPSPAVRASSRRAIAAFSAHADSDGQEEQVRSTSEPRPGVAAAQRGVAAAQRGVAEEMQSLQLRASQAQPEVQRAQQSVSCSVHGSCPWHTSAAASTRSKFHCCGKVDTSPA